MLLDLPGTSLVAGHRTVCFSVLVTHLGISYADWTAMSGDGRQQWLSPLAGNRCDEDSLETRFQWNTDE